ncbi:hypothetical protein Fmac_015211 [Flemingia macrophylla]|uniref:Uncharacterized protein n=1 Tax=Flemingia macrophylla TaxID=520843 RepID=A0ABD1MDX5_9FABA
MEEDGKVVMPHFMVGEMHQAQWEGHVVMETCTAKGMVLTLRHSALLYSTMA